MNVPLMPKLLFSNWPGIRNPGMSGNWVVTVFFFFSLFSHNFHFPLQCSSWIFDDLPTFLLQPKKVTFKIFVFSLFLLKFTTVLGDITSLLTGCSRLKKVTLVKISFCPLHFYRPLCFKTQNMAVRNILPFLHLICVITFHG